MLVEANMPSNFLSIKRQVRSILQNMKSGVNEYKQRILV